MYKLMIVEDEQLERDALHFIVTENFPDKILVVEDAINGLQAFDRACKVKPDIILMDIGIPEMSGLETQKKILEFLPNVKTLMITAYSDFQNMQSALQLKAVDYLLKPVKPAVLIKSLQVVLEELDKESDKDGSTSHTISENNNNAVFSAISFIDKNYTNCNLTLADVAKHVHLNVQYLGRIFKKQTGSSCTDYIQQVRISHAQELLQSTSMSITEISMRVGYMDATYFSRVFKKLKKQTPARYRKAASKQKH